jgi:hypothetical protein
MQMNQSGALICTLSLLTSYPSLVHVLPAETTPTHTRAPYCTILSLYGLHTTMSPLHHLTRTAKQVYQSCTCAYCIIALWLVYYDATSSFTMHDGQVLTRILWYDLFLITQRWCHRELQSSFTDSNTCKGCPTFKTIHSVVQQQYLDHSQLFSSTI